MKKTWYILLLLFNGNIINTCVLEYIKHCIRKKSSISRPVARIDTRVLTFWSVIKETKNSEKTNQEK